MLMYRGTYIDADMQIDIHIFSYKEGRPQFLINKRTQKFPRVKRDTHTCYYTDVQTHLLLYRSLHAVDYVYRDTHICRQKEGPHVCCFKEGNTFADMYLDTYRC